jgi:galactokinase
MATESASSPLRPETLRKRFGEIFGDTAGIRIARALGRVNLLGDHTDYNDGFVLPMTVDRAVYFALRRRGLVSVGFEGVLYGDVPLGGGLSSSAALEVATVAALQTLLGFDLDAVEATKLCQQVEHRYAGVQCGIMDQFASRLGRENHALLLDCRTLSHDDIPFSLGEINVVIVNTGVKRALASSKYNERRDECRQGVDFFRQFDPAVTALRDVTVDLLEPDIYVLARNLEAGPVVIPE